MNRKSIFISYSHTDRKWLTEVRKHLSVLEHEYRFEIWDDTKIKVGSHWQNDIEKSIKKCKIAILLVSSNFLASDFIRKRELPQILEVSKRDGVIIFNIIIDANNFQLTDLKIYQCLNDPRRPLAGLRSIDRDKIFVTLTQKLLDAVNEAQEEPSGTDHPPRNADAPHFLPILVLADLAKNGPKPIGEIESSTLLKRKHVVETLRKLEEQQYITKFQKASPVKLDDTQKKKPSIFWKVSELGLDIFNQFETSYKKILDSTK